MPTRALLTACAALALAAPAAAAGSTVAADPAAQRVAALDGTVVWVSGAYGAQALMARAPDGTVAAVPGAPRARSYPSIDLGHDARGRLVLTYLRCTGPGRCVARRDDLHGRRASVRGLAVRGCALSTAPAIWRSRVAYGTGCGLYLKAGTRAPRRLALPRDAVRYGAREITAVDLRADRVAAVAADIYEYAFSQTAGGAHAASFLAAASEGDSDEHARGLALGTRGTLWTLVDAEHAGDPNQAIVHRLAGACHDWQALASAPGPDQESGFAATGLAVDGEALYLVVPGTGIVAHDFAPDHAC